MANEEMLCCSCGQRVPKAIVDAVLAQRHTRAATDSARRAADEIDALLVPLRDYDKSPGIERMAAIICKHFAVASPDNEPQVVVNETEA